MHSAHDHDQHEQTNPFVFIPIVLIGTYLIYLFAVTPFQAGREHGVIEAAYAKPKKEDTGEEVFNQKELVKPTADLISLGSKIYATQCASCHGDEGYGDGTAGQRLPVKPRNFHDSAAWTNGAGVVAMYDTLMEGVGGNMPAFPALNPKQKYAVIHFIHDEFMQEVGWPETTEEEIASLPAPSAAVEININPYTETRIPVRLALLDAAEDVSREKSPHADRIPGGLGKDLYTSNCADCHGPSGEGVKPGRLMTLAQLREFGWGDSLLNKDADWANNYQEFRSIVVEGQPNGVKPGFPTLTEEELKALFDYTKSLRSE